MPDRVPKKPTPAVMAWFKVLANACKVAYMKPSNALLVRLAAHLALVGPPEDKDAQDVFWAIKGLFITQTRVHQWDRALSHIPATKEGLGKLALCYKEYASVAGTRKFETAKFDLAQVVEVILAVPDLRAYIQDAARNDFLEPRALFHPNSLQQAKERLRGAMGVLSRDRDSHSEQIARKIRVFSASGDDDGTTDG